MFFNLHQNRIFSLIYTGLISLDYSKFTFVTINYMKPDSKR